MRMIELLEKDKDNLITDLSASKTAEKAERILENELDSMLLMYNEQCRNERETAAAAYMLQAIRFSLPLIDSIGETKVWETGGSGAVKRRFRPILFVFLAAALVLCAAGLFPLVSSSYGAGNDIDFIRLAALELGGLAAALAGGLTARRPAQKETEKTQHVETNIDADKIYRSFRNAVLSVDRNLEEIRAMEKWSERSDAGRIDGKEPSSSELDLFSDLLAAAYSNDPIYALEKIEDIRFFLHRQQIEVVDFSVENMKFFDMMPGQQARTIRPALVANGDLLRKGIASAGETGRN